MTAVAAASMSRGRLRQLCRRGTLELDVLLERWLIHGYDQSTTELKELFLQLLAIEDDILQDILVKGEPPPAELSSLVSAIRKYPGSATVATGVRR